MTQVPGACARALCVAMMMVLPSLLLPAGGSGATEGAILLAVFAAAFVFVEYAGTAPSLLDFRSAPPFNRVRFGVLLATLLLLTVACQARIEPNVLSRLVAAVGLVLGHAIDGPGSPVRLIMALLPEGTSVSDAAMLRSAAGLAYLAALVGVTIFAILIRLRSWPAPNGAFNVWVNLPTFDPTAGPDVVRRLRRLGAVNILLGLVMPYLTPLLAVLLAGSHGISIFESPLMLVWAMTLWAFLPACLFLRGIALRRLALMISEQRRRDVAAEGRAAPGFLPA